MKKNKKVLICVAHSDDETIGCGGTIAAHIKNKDQVFCAYMTDGVGARSSKKKEILIKERFKNSELASKILGFVWLHQYCGNFPDNALDSVRFLDIVKKIECVKKQIKPDIIYTHNPSDLNIDHKIVAEATLTAFRPMAGETWQKILAFEVPSSTDYGYFKKNNIFVPNYFNNIDPYWNKKNKALLAYKNEIKKYPNSRSLKGIKSLAYLRGSQNGIKMAEAFQILKEIKR